MVGPRGPRTPVAVFLVSFAVLVLGACDGESLPTSAEPGSASLSENRSESLRARFDLETLGPIPYPDDNPPRAQRIELGRLLFFDPILGGEKDVACGTCHLPEFAFGDGRQFGAGVSGTGLGPDRVLTDDDLHLEPRNTQTILNTAFNGAGTAEPSADGCQFWDCRVTSLEVQATKPIESRVEMRGDAYPAEVALDSVLARLRDIPEYVGRFRGAFPGEANPRRGGGPREAVIDSSTYARAIAAYERELVARNSAFDQYVRGDDAALTPLQKDGLELFFTDARCSQCHTGPMLSNFQFVVTGTPQEGVGKSVIEGDDTGREEATGDPADRYAFRVPGLRNVEITGPYMHAGVFRTLEEVVRFYDRGARPRHDEITDDMLHPAVREPLGLTDREVEALVAFLRSLTDRGEDLPPFLTTIPERVPSGLTPVTGVASER